MLENKPQAFKNDLEMLKTTHFIQVRVLQRPSFLSEALRLPKKLDLWRTLQKSVATLAAMSFFHPCAKFSTCGFLTVV
jgi:hypothetical protein